MAFEELRKKYLPTVDPDNTIAYAGFGQAVTMGEILRRCGDDLTARQCPKAGNDARPAFHSPFFPRWGSPTAIPPDDYIRR